MGSLSVISSSSFLIQQPICTENKWNQNHLMLPIRKTAFTVRAAKLPVGVEMPKMKPKLAQPFLGFTNTAEIWNSRACMIGLIGTFIVELILHKGILQMIGVEVGKGLDIPL